MEETKINLSVQHLHFNTENNTIKYYFGLYESKNTFFDQIIDVFGVEPSSFYTVEEYECWIQIGMYEEEDFLMIRTHVNMMWNNTNDK